MGANLGRTWSSSATPTSGFLALAFFAYYLTFPIRGWRWRYVLSKVGTHIGFKDATEILFLSWFVNCLVPAKLGDLYRAYLLQGQLRRIGLAHGRHDLHRAHRRHHRHLLPGAGGRLLELPEHRAPPNREPLFLIGFIAAAVLVVFLVVLRGWGAKLAPGFPLASPTSGNASTRAAPGR